MKRDLVSFDELSREEIESLFTLTKWLKSPSARGFHPLAGKTGALIFEKQSLRTRVSFEVGIVELGGDAVVLSQDQIGLSSREAVRDIAEVLSRYCGFIVARTYHHHTVQGLAEYATVPVVNALTDLLHPCQILADAYTLEERGMLTKDVKIAFIGDGNNVVNSWLELAEKMPLHFVLACPPGFEPDAAILAKARKAGLSTIEITNDVHAAASGAGVLYTDVWVSMGQEVEKEKRRKAFEQYQINSKLLSIADPDCVVMHCLPAHRGEEITADVLEGKQSIVLDEAENRLHIQKSLLAFLMGDGLADVPGMVGASLEAVAH